MYSYETLHHIRNLELFLENSSRLDLDKPIERGNPEYCWDFNMETGELKEYTCDNCERTSCEYHEK